MATEKRGEWRAMREIEAVFHTILEERRASGRRPGDFLDQIEASFAELAAARARRAGGARPDADPDGRAVEPVRGARLDAREPAAAPRRAGARRGRRRRRCSSARRTSRSAWRSARSPCAACCSRSRSRPRPASTGSRPACSSPRMLSVNNAQRGARPRPLRPGPLPRPPAVGRGRAARARAGLDLRPRPPLLPGAALLDLRDPDRDPPPARALRARAALPSAAGRARGRSAASRARPVRASCPTRPRRST